MRARAGTARADAHGEASDGEHVVIAASLQLNCPLWLVMWSRWHQTYTAFACFTREPVIVEEARVDAFLTRIKQVEMANGIGLVA